MFVLVLLAFFRAKLTCDDASMNLLADKFRDRLGLAQHDAEGRRANVRAIEIGANAAPHHRDVVFRQTGVGANGARRDAAGERLERLR